MRRYAHAVDFLFVYVMEAHAADEWPLGARRSTTAQHRSIDERRAAARRTRARYHTRSDGGIIARDGGSAAVAAAAPPATPPRECGNHDQMAADLEAVATVRWVVDSMANEFYRAFGAWPEGHVVVGVDGTLRLCTEAQDGEGCVAGGEWQRQVERVLSEDCGVTPCGEVEPW